MLCVRGSYNCDLFRQKPSGRLSAPRSGSFCVNACLMRRVRRISCKTFLMADSGLLVARYQGLHMMLCSIVLPQVDSPEVTAFSLEVGLHPHGPVLTKLQIG